MSECVRKVVYGSVKEKSRCKMSEILWKIVCMATTTAASDEMSEVGRKVTK